MTESDLVEFRRCPTCFRIEVVETGEVVAPGNDHDQCSVPVDHWVHFRAPADWRPALQ